MSKIKMLLEECEATEIQTSEPDDESYMTLQEIVARDIQKMIIDEKKDYYHD